MAVAADDDHSYRGHYLGGVALATALTHAFTQFAIGVLGLKARDLIGYTFVQFIIHVPIVLILLWLLGMTLNYQPPVMP